MTRARPLHGRGRGFTLIELIVSITISAIVVVFVALFMQAPLNAYEWQSRRVALTADATAAWPLMEADLRAALPNSLRTRRHPGGFVALEMLKVLDWARYEAPLVDPITIAGTFRDMPPPLPFNDLNPNLYYLSVNNPGAGSADDAYTLTGSMTAANTNIRIAASATPDELEIRTLPAHLFPAGSPSSRIYLVEGPVTFLCDENTGTLQRYENYPIAATQASRDAAPAALGVPGLLLARGLTTCNFDVSPVSPTEPQTAAVILTATRNGDFLTLMHAARAEYLP